MGDNARTYSILSITFGVIAIFFVGIIASILAIIFASIAMESYDDDSDESKAGLTLGVVILCIMGLIIIGTIFSILASGVMDPQIIGFLFYFGPCGFSAMATGGSPIPLPMYYFY